MDKNPGVGIGLIIIGLIYWLKPNIFQRWFWKRTDILQRILGPEKYLVFINGFGICLTVVGIILSFFAFHNNNG
jgi:hypothetical protein